MITPPTQEAGIALAGGRAARLGGADKAVLVVDGRPLLDHALAALVRCDPVVVVGPEHLAREGVRTTREEPPLGGPAADVAAGVAALGTSPPGLAWLLACDLPRATGLVGQVRSALTDRPLAEDEDGAVVRDDRGRDQWLAGLYRTSALTARLAEFGDPNGAPLHRLVGPLRLRRVPDATGDSIDLDTWEDVDRHTGHGAGAKEELVNTTGPGAGQAPRWTTPPPVLGEWVADLAPLLGLDPATVPTQQLLDLAREVAHTVTRPAGPITTYLIGRAVTEGTDPQQAIATVTAAVERWRADHPSPDDQKET